MTRLALLAAVLAAACGRPPVAARPDVPPPPALAAEATRSVATLASPVDRTALVVQTIAPAAGEVRAVLVVQHGLKDHVDNYAELAGLLAARGFATVGGDLRGHGRSAGPRVVVDDFDDYVADLGAVVAHARAAYPGRPVFLFGHSMGGVIATRYAEAHDDLAGLILSAPALGLMVGPLTVATATVGAATTPNLPMLATPHDDISSNPEVVAALDRDPLVAQGNGPVHTALEMALADEAAWAAIDRLAMPLLLLHGTADALTAPAATREVYRRAPAADKTFRIYDGLAHDLLHERAKAQVQGDVVAWLDDHAAGEPSAIATSADLDRALGGDGWKPAGALRSTGGYEAWDGGWRARFDVDLRILGGKTLGWAGGFEGGLSWGEAPGFGYGAALYPLGIGFADGGGGAVSTLMIGAGLFGGGGDTELELPAHLHIELPLAGRPIVIAGRVAMIKDAPGDDVIDAMGAQLGIRLGRHHRFFPGASGGGGLYVAATWQRVVAAELDVWGVAIGTAFSGLRW
jgi:alpha-beta hydrolase superfamily lysophospholipase